VTEITKPPVQYPAVALIGAASSLGAVAALGIASLVTTSGLNWRIAFWIGAAIAVVGSVARLKLRETPEFVDMKRKLQNNVNSCYLKNKQKELKEIKEYIIRCKKDKINKETLTACFLIQCGWGLVFYLGFMYFNPILKAKYGYSANDIIFHNFWLSIVMLVSRLFWAKLSYSVNPLKIVKNNARLFGVLILFLPVLSESHNYQIFILQSLLLTFCLCSNPAEPFFIKALPVFKRFTTTSFMYAMSRALVYVITSFGLVYLTETFGHYGVWVIALPITMGFLWGVNHFEKLENQKQHEVHTPHPLSIKLDEHKLVGKIP
jgi:MFS family permease